MLLPTRSRGRIGGIHCKTADDTVIIPLDGISHIAISIDPRRAAKSEIADDDMKGRLAELEKEDRIEQLLVELKTKRGA